MDFPIARYLVPAPTDEVPEGWTLVDEARIQRAFPVEIQLSKTLTLKWVAPTGLAKEWLEASATEVVSESAADEAPHAPDPSEPTMNLDRAPCELIVRSSGFRIGTVPLRKGVSNVVRGDGAGAVVVELMVLGWKVCAGNIRGAGDYGTSIRLVWRVANKGVDHFATPPISEFVKRRTLAHLRIESRLGLRRKTILRRFIQRRETLK